MSSVARDLLPAPFVLHRCAAAGCARVALGARCQAHMTDTDRQALDDLHIAVLAASEAEERWRDARLRVREAECAAGVRRANPDLE